MSHVNLRTMTIAALLASPLLAGAAAPVPAPAPALELYDSAGQTLRLDTLKGKVVLVDFWASWCGPCKNSFPVLDGLYRQRHERGLEVLAVNVDEDRRQAEDFLALRPHAMPVFFDPGGQGPTAFHVQAMPSSYLIDRAGNIRFRHEGFNRSTGEAYAREIDQLLSEEASHDRP